MKAFTFLLTMIFLTVSVGFAQKASAGIDTNNILIGDHINLKLSYTFPANGVVIWPAIGDTLSKNIEVITRSELDTIFTSDKKKITFNQTVTITSFDSGSFVIPPIEFAFHLPGDTNKVHSFTNPITIFVNTVPVDTNLAIKDIKGLLKEPITFEELLPWILGGLVLIALILAIIFVIRRKRGKKPLISIKKTVIPPHIRALNKLNELREKKIWQKGMVKEFHSSLSDIIRTYIEEAYNIPAMEMISEDIIFKLNSTDIQPDSIKRLQNIFKLTDMVKFAKFNPLPDENDNNLKNAVIFVNETAPKVELVEEKEDLKTENSNSETSIKKEN